MRRAVDGAIYQTWDRGATAESVENADVPSQELEHGSWLSWCSARRIEKLGCTMAKLPRDCLGRNCTRLESGLLHRRQEDTLKKIKGTRHRKALAEKNVVKDLEVAIVKTSGFGQVVSTASGARHVTG